MGIVSTGRSEATRTDPARSDVNVSQRIDRLDGMIRQLRIQYEQFFNGALEVPPEQLRSEVQGELRSLRQANLKGVEENFRLSNLEARFNSYSEMFGRRTRNLEEGRGLEGRRDAGSRPGAERDPERGVTVGDEVEQEAVEALYQGLHRSGSSRPRFDMDSFRSYLDRQLHTIRRKTGCDRVVFRIAEEQGKMKLKARPVRESSDG